MNNIRALAKVFGEAIGTHVKTVGGESENKLVSNIESILQGVIGVLGLACVVVMIIGGVNYMTSSGDTQKVKKAKDTILYGLIGLVVCVLAFALVNWVIGTVLGQEAAPTATTQRTAFPL